MIDKDKMIGEIAKRLDIRLDCDDPAFVLVELNRLMMEEFATELSEIINSAGEQISHKLNNDTRALIAESERLTRRVSDTAIAAEKILINTAKKHHDELEAHFAVKRKAAVIEPEKTTTPTKPHNTTIANKLPQPSNNRIAWHIPVFIGVLSGCFSSGLIITALLSLHLIAK